MSPISEDTIISRNGDVDVNINNNNTPSTSTATTTTTTTTNNKELVNKLQVVLDNIDNYWYMLFQSAL